LLGRERSMLLAPFSSVVIGMTTLPAISPGDPVCNLGKLPKGTQPAEYRRMRFEEDGLEERLSEDLASNILIFAPNEDSLEWRIVWEEQTDARLSNTVRDSQSGVSMQHWGRGPGASAESLQQFVKRAPRRKTTLAATALLRAFAAATILWTLALCA